MIRMSEATVVYENGTRAVNKASLRVDEGEFVFLVGASGSGKTTIIKLLTGEVRPSEGRVIVNNYDIGRMKKRQIPYLRRTLGVVYQDFRLINTKTVYENVAFAMRAIGAKGKAIKQRVPYVLDLVGLADKAHEKPMNLSGGEQQRVAIARALVNNPRLIIADEPTGNLDPALINTKTVYENVAFAMRAIGAKGKAIKQRVPYVLDLVGLADKAHEKPMNLSGGEQQRVAIARALVNNPRLIIADEPTGNLDPARSLELMTLFEKINELGTTVLIVTHEKGLVDEFEKRVVVIDNGEVISDQTGGYYQI